MNRTRILYPETGVLVVSPADCDHLALARIFAHTSWQTRGAFSWNEARCWVEMHRTAVVISVDQMDGSKWVELAEEFAARPAAPELIVTAGAADRSLWAEVFNRDAYDLLVRPFVADEVIRTVSGAWRRFGTHAVVWPYARTDSLRRTRYDTTNDYSRSGCAAEHDFTCSCRGWEPAR